jgi:hypothetical protein
MCVHFTKIESIRRLFIIFALQHFRNYENTFFHLIQTTLFFIRIHVSVHNCIRATYN